ncbi:MAG: hypothetical protein ACRDOY_12125 [Nocardioidaceae bacterium]
MAGSAGTDEGKAGFGHVYNRPDPRRYFQTLGALDYEIPQHAHATFAALLEARRDTSPSTEAESVLDICCSYGINAALLRCDLTLADLFRRYDDPALAELTPEELATVDRDFFAHHCRTAAPRVLGLDAAERAVAYGCDVGLLDAGWAENLEDAEPSPELLRTVDNVGLITITGGVGYITERTFDRLLQNLPLDRMPWVAAFVLRMYPYDRIADTLAQHGLVTERLEGTTFRQRRFASAQERTAALAQTRSQGIDTCGKEDTGWYHCDLFVSRPPDQLRRVFSAGNPDEVG